MPRTWSVLGGGAMGCLWAARLNRAGEKATLLLRATDPHAVKPLNTILRVQSASRTAINENENADHEREFVGKSDFHVDVEVDIGGSQPIGRLLVTTKAHDTRRALQQVQHRLAPSSVVVILCQQPTLYRELCKDPELKGVRYLLGSTANNAHATQRFHVVHSRSGPSWFGTPPGSSISVDELTDVTNSLGRGGLGAEVDNNIILRLWDSMAACSSINPLTALLQCPVGFLLESEHCRTVMRDVCREASRLLEAEGIQKSANALYEHTVRVAQEQATHISSMSEDMRMGRPTEVDFFSGYIARRLRDMGGAAPASEMLWTLVRAKGDAATAAKVRF